MPHAFVWPMSRTWIGHPLVLWNGAGGFPYLLHSPPHRRLPCTAAGADSSWFLLGHDRLVTRCPGSSRNFLDIPLSEFEGSVVVVHSGTVSHTRRRGSREGQQAPALPSVRTGRRLQHFFEATADRVPHQVALEDDLGAMTYGELERRANQLAHHLRDCGVGAGARVGILLRRSRLTYISLLAALKAGAAFVPIDPASPRDRVAYIADDADIDLLVTTSDLAVEVSQVGRKLLELDLADDALDAASPTRPGLEESGDAPCYVMYTSGSSGRPKGVEVAQSSVCNFIDVVPEVYDVRPTDRVYQGMTISFDFSIEEIWPTLAVGATLVVGPDDSRRFGDELGEFLQQAGVTVLYCVPTLLATISRNLPTVRSLLVGGEACPAGLVERWSTPGRRMLNTYGPTEATVTATWCELEPGRPVTIGWPLPTYSVVLLDEEGEQVPDGEVGEICIGGPGVASGYVGMPEKTAERFIEHPLASHGGRLYRTGDLGRRTVEGEIEYLGRADAEVKIRGRRVDLGEIDTLLLEDPEVAAAVAAPARGSDASAELAAYVTRRFPGGDDRKLADRLQERLRRRLPDYMMPTYLDVLTELPTMTSGKVDRSRLPAPSGRRLIGAPGPFAGPVTDLEEQVAAVWAEVFGLERDQLSVEADFFADLGGHSLRAATVVSLLREREVGGSPAIRDLYTHPTVRSLAGHLRTEESREGTPPEGAPDSALPAPRPGPLRHRARRVRFAGSAQGGFLYALLLLVTLPVAVVYSRYDGAVSVAGVLPGLAAAAAVSYLGLRWLLPPVLARVLSAGIRPGRYRLWGLTYLRLWALETVLAFAPLPALSGSPLLAPYLRLLGARVGRRSHIATSVVSLPRMVDIGDDATLGYGVHVRPWVVEDGWVVVQPVTVCPRGLVGSSAVLEPGATVGEGAAVAEHSVIGQRQEVPPGHCWGGSPPRTLDGLDPLLERMRAEPPAPGWRGRHLAAAVAGLGLLELLAIVMVAPGVVLVWSALLTWGLLPALAAAALVGPVFVVTVCLVVAGARLLVLPRTPVGVHFVRSGLGVRKWVADKLLETSLTVTNSLYATLYTVPWLRALGARVGRGAEISTAAHLDPDLLVLGKQSFVADMASVGSASFCNGRVAFQHTEVGRRAFVGNAAHLPAGTRVGKDSLVGVHTVPPPGGVPDGTSWLGSPAMYLPRRQDSGSFAEGHTFRPPRRRVAERLVIEFFRVTMPASVLAVAVYLYLLALSELAGATGALTTLLVAPALAALASLAVVLVVAAIKWVTVGVYRPRVEPLWSGFVRRTEFVTGLYEAAAVPALLGLLVGTPLLPLALRLFGARIGRRTWIGTTFLTEFDLVRVGHDAAVGPGVSLQTHLFEDRVMKMSTVRICDGATVGGRSIVLYDAVVGSGAGLDALSLLLKGEQLPQGTRWRGIPAQGVR